VVVPPANSPPVRVELVPGTTWRYSGGGTSIVQQLIVDVSGDRFPDHMRRNVLEALAMTNSTFEQPIEGLLAERTASGHDATGAVLHGRWHTYPEMAAAGLWTTPSDLARLIVGVQRSFRGDRTGLISVDLAREMLTVQHGSHGLGFEIARCGDATCYSHAGANAGFRAFLIGVAETGQGAVVMTNGDAGIPVALAIVRRLAETYGWPGSSR
jgi:CubicO group peptidase (beta-lactamase class C family)